MTSLEVVALSKALVTPASEPAGLLMGRCSENVFGRFVISPVASTDTDTSVCVRVKEIPLNYIVIIKKKKKITLLFQNMACKI